MPRCEAGAIKGLKTCCSFTILLSSLASLVHAVHARAHLRAPHDGAQRPLGRIDRPLQVLELLVQQVSRGAQLHVLGDAGGGTVRPVRRAEGIPAAS